MITTQRLASCHSRSRARPTTNRMAKPIAADDIFILFFKIYNARQQAKVSFRTTAGQHLHTHTHTNPHSNRLTPFSKFSLVIPPLPNSLCERFSSSTIPFVAKSVGSMPARRSEVPAVCWHPVRPVVA